STERDARQRFGNPTLIREGATATWGFSGLDTFVQDLRFGLRLLRRSPGFAVATVSLLAIGIGANTAIFSIADALLLRPLAVPNPAGLKLFKRVEPAGSAYTFPYRWYKRFRDQPAVFSHLGATWMVDRYNVRSGNMDEERVSISLASG